MAPVISVLMPARLRHGGFTEWRWFMAALESACEACTGHDFELLLIDDQSPEPLILPEAAPAEVRLLRTPARFGLIRALNYAASHARGEFLARIDADDLWTPDRIPRQLRAFADDPDLSLVFGGMHLMDEAGRITETHLRAFDHTETLAFFPKGGCAIPHGSVLMRSSIFVALGGYPYAPDSLHTEDFALWSVWARFFRVLGLPEVLLNYRVHNDSVSAAHRERQTANSRLIMKRAAEAGPAEEYVASLETLAGAWRLSGLETGLRLLDLWRYGGCVQTPAQALPALRRVLFDRCIQRLSLDADHGSVRVSDF